MESKGVRKIDIFNILNYVFKKWFIVLIVGVLFAGTIGGMRYMDYKVWKSNESFAQANSVTPIYGSFVVYINNFDDSDNYYNRIEDVQAIIRSYSNLTKLIESNKLDINYTTMNNCISIVSSGINQIEVSIDGSLIGLNQETVVKLADSFSDIVMQEFDSMFGKDSLIMVDEAHAQAYVLTKSIEAPDVKPVTKMSVIKYGILGGVIGVIAGCFMVIFYVLLSTVLRSRNEVVQCFAMNLIGDNDKLGSDKEGFARIKSRIVGYKTLAFASVSNEDYRSVTIDKIAESMASNGKTVCVVRINDVHDVEANPLYQYETGKIKLNDMIHDSYRKEVKLVEWSYASTVDIDLFTNSKFIEAVKEMSNMFDHVLVDCPSVRESFAAYNVAKVCDTMVVVATAGHIKEAEVVKMRNDIKANNINSAGLIYIA